MINGKPVALDICCGGGGASEGYSRAGFAVYGIDIKAQPNYPFYFKRVDALEYEIPAWVTFVHASPPCQLFSAATPPERRAAHPNLIPALREKLQRWGGPYVIENVPGSHNKGNAALQATLMLCGTMFGLKVIRHRYFESNCLIPSRVHPRGCKEARTVKNGGEYYSVFGGLGGKWGSVAQCSAAMEIDWMGKRSLVLSIPPAYTQYIGQAIKPYLRLTYHVRAGKKYPLGAWCRV